MVEKQAPAESFAAVLHAYPDAVCAKDKAGYTSRYHAIQRPKDGAHITRLLLLRTPSNTFNAEDLRAWFRTTPDDNHTTLRSLLDASPHLPGTEQNGFGNLGLCSTASWSALEIAVRLGVESVVFWSRTESASVATALYMATLSTIPESACRLRVCRTAQRLRSGAQCTACCLGSMTWTRAGQSMSRALARDRCCSGLPGHAGRND